MKHKLDIKFSNNINVSSKTFISTVAAFFAGCLILFFKEALLMATAICGFVVLYFYLLKDFELWQRNLIILLGGYFILTKGFSYIGFHIGRFYIFISEITIFLSLILHNFKFEIVKLFKHVISKWVITWVTLGFILSMLNIYQYQLLSIARDYAMVYYSIFILFGYAFYKNYKNLEKSFKIIGWFFIAHTFWGLFYPLRTVIVAISPKLMGIVPLFNFQQDANSTLFVGGILYFLLVAKQYKWPKLLTLLMVVVQFCLLLIFQVRAVYVGCFFVFLFLFIMHKKSLVFKTAVILIIIFGIGFISNFEMEGRRNRYDIVSARSILEEFASIFTPRRSGTATFRLLWWKAIVNNSLNNPKLFFFGRGFGPSLAIGDYFEVGEKSRKGEEFRGLAKSPHNIILTIFGRMGAIGLLLWLGFNYVFFRYIVQGIMISKRLNEYKICNNLAWIASFVLMVVWASIFGTLLESPFMAIPYFFFMGLGIAIVDELMFNYKRIKQEVHI